MNLYGYCRNQQVAERQIHPSPSSPSKVVDICQEKRIRKSKVSDSFEVTWRRGRCWFLGYLHSFQVIDDWVDEVVDGVGIFSWLLCSVEI